MCPSVHQPEHQRERMNEYWIDQLWILVYLLLVYLIVRDFPYVVFPVLDYPHLAPPHLVSPQLDFPVVVTQEEMAEAQAFPKFHIVVVDALPDDAEYKSESTIYLVKSVNDEQNLYTEYIYVNNAWEKLGEQKLDLSGYALKSEAICSVDDNDEDGYKTIEFRNGNDDIVATVIINLATSSTAGLLSPSDKDKLDLISWYEGN